MTVGDLRRLIADLDDKMPVKLIDLNAPIMAHVKCTPTAALESYEVLHPHSYGCQDAARAKWMRIKQLVFRRGAP